MSSEKKYIITKHGFADLDAYFTMHKDPIMRNAWKNFKNKEIHPHIPSDRDETLHYLEKMSDLIRKDERDKILNKLYDYISIKRKFNLELYLQSPNNTSFVSVYAERVSCYDGVCKFIKNLYTSASQVDDRKMEKISELNPHPLFGKPCSGCGRPIDWRGKCHECLNDRFLNEEYDACYENERRS